MSEKDLDKLSLGLCLMVFSFDLIVFTMVAALGAFLVFQVAHKYEEKNVRLNAIIYIVMSLASFFLLKFSNDPKILAIRIIISILELVFLYKTFKAALPLILVNQKDIGEETLLKRLKLISLVDALYIIVILIPLISFTVNSPMLIELSSLILRSDVATSILFVLLFAKYIISKPYRDLNYIHRQYSMNEEK